MENAKRKRQAKVLRNFRKIHRLTGILLFAFFFIVALTGLLLGWKKQTGLLPKSAKGISTSSKDWLPIDSLQAKADAYLLNAVSSGLSLKMDRIDIRPDKGMVKFVYADHYWGLQLDCTTGELLQIDKRASDFIEQIHDGSILDHQFTGKDIFKLVYTSIMGIALLIFTITGFWLWYGPKRMRKIHRPHS
ncbi:MAG: PepSY domain-containing protein [Chitinophagaceae bacterium]